MKLIIEKIVQETHDLVSTSASSWTVGMQIDHMLAHAAAGDERVLSISLSITDDEWNAIRSTTRATNEDWNKAADAAVDMMLETPSMAAPAPRATKARPFKSIK